MACNNDNPWQFGDCEPGQIVALALRGQGFRTESLSPLYIVDFISTQLAYLAYLLGVIGIIVGSILLITSSGDKTKQSNGKNVITMSVLAIIIVLFVYNILKIVLNIFGYTPPERT